MTRYAISIDLDTVKMRETLSGSEITRIYQKELPEALFSAGFREQQDGLFFMTQPNADGSLIPIIVLEQTLKEEAPTACKYFNRVRVFEIEAFADITSLFGYEKEEPETTET